MVQKIVLCDMDGICADLQGKLIDAVNKDNPDANMTKDKVTTHEFSKCFPIGDKVWDYVGSNGWFEDLKPLPGAVAGLSQLHDAGLKIVMATAPTRNPNSSAEKRRWIKKHLTFVHHRHVMMGPLKYMLKGDFFIDDSPDQQKQFRAAWPDTPILTIQHAFPANKGVTIEAPDYHDTEKAWKVIVKEILARAA